MLHLAMVKHLCYDSAEVSRLMWVIAFGAGDRRFESCHSADQGGVWRSGLTRLKHPCRLLLTSHTRSCSWGRSRTEALRSRDEPLDLGSPLLMERCGFEPRRLGNWV